MKLYLKKITFVVIISIICSFSIRAFGTIFPQIFNYIYMVKITILVNVSFILSHFLFWLVFYMEYASARNPIFKITCFLAVMGSFAVSFLYLKELPFVFNIGVAFSLFLMNSYIEALLPFIGSIFQLIFFVTFRNSMTSEEERLLGRPILSIIVGISLFLFFQLVVLVNFIAGDKFEWLEHMPRVAAAGSVLLIITAVFLILIFYYRFYYFLDSGYKIRAVDDQ